jgi:hypothetical protein
MRAAAIDAFSGEVCIATGRVSPGRQYEEDASPLYLAATWEVQLSVSSRISYDARQLLGIVRIVRGFWTIWGNTYD